jgi:histidyl-tRNA synthetase
MCHITTKIDGEIHCYPNEAYYPTMSNLKTACGTRDFSPVECLLRETLMDDLKLLFKRYNAVPLETPVFELKDNLMKKYGDDTKLIYEIKNSSDDLSEEKDSDASQKEVLCLRYDLTVPLARYLVQNGIVKMRRYQIAKVYRRDLPNISRGRYREFYQADIDIIGEPETLIPETQLLKLGAEALQKYGIEFKIKFNFRNNLTEILSIAGIGDDQILTICSSIDKLDKKSWEELMPEFNSKGANAEQIAKIRELLTANYMSADTLGKYTKLVNYTKLLGLEDQMQYDCYLARGMDYYTGLIFEFVVPSAPDLGTIIAGGRYDNLCQIFKKSVAIPALGLSIGFERLFDYLMQKQSKIISIEVKPPTYYLAMVTKGASSEEIRDLTDYKMSLYGHMLAKSQSIKVILDTEENAPLSRQIQSALDIGADYLIFVGGRELDKKQVAVKNLSIRNQKTLYFDEFILSLIN